MNFHSAHKVGGNVYFEQIRVLIAGTSNYPIFPFECFKNISVKFHWISAISGAVGKPFNEPIQSKIEDFPLWQNDRRRNETGPWRSEMRVNTRSERCDEKRWATFWRPLGAVPRRYKWMMMRVIAYLPVACPPTCPSPVKRHDNRLPPGRRPLFSKTQVLACPMKRSTQVFGRSSSQPKMTADIQFGWIRFNQVGELHQQPTWSLSCAKKLANTWKWGVSWAAVATSVATCRHGLTGLS